MAENFELVCSFRVLDSIQVEKYKSKRTGMTVCFAQVPGPLVNGFFSLATEAHDDDGLPHTLEHLIFMGSESYPYKGLLDLLANRCLAQGTNAWTDTDHTCYTMTTAGSEGFLNLLPIYLDHVLYPTLTESAYVTEIHHINEEGENAGVVYCEMQARENTGESLTHLSLLRNMYPGHCGYKSETGGIMKNLRTTCSHKKVCDYHHQFYRPENLCLLITGQMRPEDVFQRITPFESKIVSKGPMPPHIRPWQSAVPPLKESVLSKIQFASDDEETGLVLIGFRGPMAADNYSLEALKVVLTYLTDSPVATLQRLLVENPDPYCSDVGFEFIENSEGCFYIRAENVPTEKLEDVVPKITEATKDIVDKKVDIDMKRMSAVIHREALDAMEKIEDKPHYTFAGFCIGDFLYSTESHHFLDKVDTISHLRKLAQEPQDFWRSFVDQYLVQRHSIAVIGEPSKQLMTEMSEREKKRVKEQKESLGEHGLREKATRLMKANEENGVEPPSDLVSSLPIPSVSSIHFHEVRTASNNTKVSSDNMITTKFSMEAVPFSFQVDHISSMFVEITVLMDTVVLPENLKPYLSLYIAVILESPVLRDGVLVSHEDIVAQLTEDVLDYSSCLGLNGGRFRPGKFPQLAVITFKIEVDKYNKAIGLLGDILYNTQFTADRMKVVVKRMTKEITKMKREGRTVVNALIKSTAFSKESPYRYCNFIQQQNFLKGVLQELNTKPDKIISDLTELRKLLTAHSNLRVHVAANINNLPEKASEIWQSGFVPHISSANISSLPDVLTVSKFLSQEDKQGKIVGVGSVESSFLVQTCRAVDDFNDKDLAPLLVFMECLTALEGPMWRQIRGLGLSYHYSMRVDPEQGLLYFILFKATHLVKAYEKAKEIMDNYLSGRVLFDAVQLESAISSVIFEIIEREESVSDASFENMLSQLRNVSKDYNKNLLQKISKVTLDDLKRVGNEYLTRLFSPEDTNCAICCHPSKVGEIKDAFEKFGRKLEVVSSLDEEMK